jgi:predicted nucleotidyltransferase
MVHNWDNLDFEILLKLIKNSSHVRALSLDLNASHSTISRKLNILKKSNYVDFSLEGKNKKYFLKKNIRVKKALILSENYKLLKFFSSNPTLIPLISDILKTSKSRLIVIFGSYAKGLQSVNSDLDIYVESRSITDKKELEKLNTKISVKYSIFDSENLLIKEIIKNHVIVRGVEDFYDKKGVFD